MLLLVMAYRLLREFRQASTRLDTPPFSNRHHLVSAIAPPTLPPVSSLRRDCSTGSEPTNRSTPTDAIGRAAAFVAVVQGSGGWAQCSLPRLGSGDSDVIRAS